MNVKDAASSKGARWIGYGQIFTECALSALSQGYLAHAPLPKCISNQKAPGTCTVLSDVPKRLIK